MKKIVCDTNVLVSGFMYSGNEREVIKKIYEGEIINFTSRELIIEFVRVIRRRKFRLTEKEQKRILEFLIEISENVKPKKRINVIKEDSEDNRVIECALESKADYIISGDRHLLTMKRYKGIKILNAKRFLGI